MDLILLLLSLQWTESRHKYTKTPNQEQNDTNHTMPIADDGAVHPVPGRAITSGHQVDYQHAMHQQPRGEKSQHAIEQQLTYVTAESTSGPAPRGNSSLNYILLDFHIAMDSN